MKSSSSAFNSIVQSTFIFLSEVTGPYGCYRAQLLELLYFTWETSPHPICITVIQGCKTIFTNIQYVCFAILIKFHFNLFLLLTAVWNGRWSISKILCSRCCNSGVGKVAPGKQNKWDIKNELFSRFFCLFAVLCCGSSLYSHVPVLLVVERIYVPRGLSRV